GPRQGSHQPGLPAFDYVCAHGLLTWIAPAKRRALLACAASWLKPGGLLYLGYNALPGWAAVEPLRRFMLDTAAAFAGGREDSIRHALAAAKALCDGGATYFVANPSAKEILATMLQMGVPYAAHEFFHANWEPMYFTDVAGEAAEHDLRFVGQLPLHLNYGDMAIPPALKEAFRSAPDRRAWEHLKAFATNEFFRRDVYVKGTVPRTGNEGRAYLEGTPFGTFVAADQVQREAVLPNRTLHFTGPLFDALIAALARRASTVVELAAEPSLAPYGAEAIRQAVVQLAMGNDVIPMNHTGAAPGSGGARYRIPSAFNRAILAQPPARNQALTLASPVAGTGVRISLLHAVALRALTEVRPDERAAWIRGFVDANPLRLWDHGRALDDKEDLALHLGVQIEHFCATRLAKLIELGIVEGDDR
ncbi:MAG TPA: class I SAM-dependent methyltransferase, partial [Polyangiaceae bacterium]|nr:class I SAM-dependent methyltransferase [Polyangiaceae bacterium]